MIFHGRSEFSGGVATGIGLSGNLHSKMGAQRFPAVAEIVDEKPLGRHRGLDRRDIGFIDGDGVVAVIGPAPEDLLSYQRDAERVRIGALPEHWQQRFLDARPPAFGRAVVRMTLACG